MTLPRLPELQSRTEDGEFARALDEEQWAQLTVAGRPRRYPAGAYLLHEGGPADVVHLLLAGRVKIVAASVDGVEHLIALRGPGTLLGELSALDGRERSASVVAMEPVLALVLTTAAFVDYLAATPRVTLGLLRGVVGRLRDADRRRAEFGSLDAETRVAARLVELAERFGSNQPDGVRITVPITQDELAAWIGASREAVVKALRSLRSRGWIETERRAVLVRDLAALRRRAGH